MRKCYKERKRNNNDKMDKNNNNKQGKFNYMKDNQGVK